MALTEQQALDLKTALKRCRPETLEAALRFRESGDPAEVPTIVYGIIERHLVAEATERLAGASDDTRLVEDLGIDSLTMLEIVLSVEETLNISIENEQLKDIHTLGEVKTFIAHKVAGGSGEDAAARTKLRRYDREAIAGVLPQQPPFLFLDEAELEEQTVRARYTVRGDEQFLEGHFKNNPIFPASIVFEALGQAACLWVLENLPDRSARLDPAAGEVLFASMENAHFYRRAKPGDTLEFEAKLHQMHEPLAVFDGVVKVRGERLAHIEHLVLAFGAQVAEHLHQAEEASAGSASANGAHAPGLSAAAPRPAPAGAESLSA